MIEDARRKAKRTTEPQQRCIIAPVASVLNRPDGRQVTQALYGESADVYEQQDGWYWVQLKRDSYVGYVRAGDLGPATPATHRVSVPLALTFPDADIKSRPAIALPLNAIFAATEHDAKFLALADGRFICRVHTGPLATDFVAVAEQFAGVPYLWGGKSFAGIDCSGLVQVALQASGAEAPRDSDMQENELGTAIVQASDLRRGDLVFWKGHVGIMQDSDTLLHANGTHMMVVSEPLQGAITRIAATGSPVTSIKRL